MKGQITFLHHSGFLYENESYIYVFDAWQDPGHCLAERLQSTDKKVYFFASHSHGDHFNPNIADYEDRAAGYFLHRDCHLSLANQGKLHLMEVGETVQAEDFTVHMYGSTDIGGSFMIQGRDVSLFHAGDLNWWHWAGEPTEANREARAHFFAELSKIKETHVEAAFLPVDARQAVAREWGVKAFLQQLRPEWLIPMHAFGPAWVPSYEFRWLYPQQKIWIPQYPGDCLVGEKS